MIIDNIKNYSAYHVNDYKIAKALEFIKNKDFSEEKKGIYHIDGEQLYYVVAEYNTKNLEDGFWESHKKYIDIHYIISGQEKHLYSNFDNMQIKKEYNEKDDAYILNGDSEGEVILKKGSFALYFPQDVHMTGIKIKDQESIKKIIFKVVID